MEWAGIVGMWPNKVKRGKDVEKWAGPVGMLANEAQKKKESRKWIGRSLSP